MESDDTRQDVTPCYVCGAPTYRDGTITVLEVCTDNPTHVIQIATGDFN